MSGEIRPGDLLKARAQGNRGAAGQLMARMKRKASGPIKLTGSFQGKSNALGHGGRAAQLKARGVPGGVIGNLARAAGAAPRGPNFHGKRSKKKRKVAIPPKGEMGMVMKRTKRKGAAHIASRTGFDAGGKGSRNLHEEKRSKGKEDDHDEDDNDFKRKGACKVCGKTAAHSHKSAYADKRMKRKTAKKA